MDQELLLEKTDALAFPPYPSLPIDKSSETYRQNITDWTEVLKTYQEGLEWCASQGSKHYEDRHKERGLLLGIPRESKCWELARDRVRLLLDPDTPFLELGSFAGYKLDTSSPSASIITGIGVIWYTHHISRPNPKWSKMYGDSAYSDFIGSSMERIHPHQTKSHDRNSNSK